MRSNDCFVLIHLFYQLHVLLDARITLFFLIRTSNFAAEAEPKLNVLIFFTF